MNNNFEFREAVIADIPELIELRQKQLTDEGTVAPFDISKELYDYFHSSMRDKSFVCQVAVLNDKIISNCSIAFGRKPPYYQNTSGIIGEICNVFTEREFRQLGIAKKLLQRVIDKAKERGVTAIRVSASEVGKFLYKDFGFSKAENFYIFKIET